MNENFHPIKNVDALNLGVEKPFFSLITQFFAMMTAIVKSKLQKIDFL